MDPAKYDVMRDVSPLLDDLLLLLKPVDACWQPSDLLPRMGTPEWREEVEALREEATRLSDEMLVVLAGNIVTEEALPSYLAELNRFVPPESESGTSSNPWSRWSRAWTAEEKRHGDVTRAYVFLSGRIELRSLELTVQHLLRNGFDTGAERDPYRGLTYASFQEHATKVSWSQLGRVVGSVGASRLHRICGEVAADEARHERVYVALLKAVLARDPEGAVEALHHALGRTVVMPARLMTDGRDRRLFSHFAEVGQRLGVYTVKDYFDNIEGLIETLGLETLSLAGDAGAARDRICDLPRTQRQVYETVPPSPRRVPFRWIHDRRA
jgi:acyl-[acyl-carrier-protein] desaturase